MRQVILLGCLTVLLLMDAAHVCQAQPRPRGSSSQAAPRGSTDVWQVIYLGKSKIGYSHSFTHPVVLDGKSLLKCENQTHLAIKRFGQTLKIEMRQETKESADGELSAFDFEMKNPPAAPTRAVGHVDGNRLAGELTVAGTPQPFSLPLDAGVKSPAYLERLPNEHPFKMGERLAFKVFL